MALVYFKALSDETRLRLVHILLHYELSVNELVRILGMGQSRVSRHLKILTEAGLLTSRRDGLWVFYAATRCGEASDFLQAMGPFLHTDTAMREDLAMAAQILEERALKTRQFFNAIAEDWDELNREVLEDFDLPAAVLAAVPEGCRVAVDLGCGTGAVLERLLPASRSLIGVDGSARMLEMCRRRFNPVDLANENRISLRIGELDHLPLRDQEADFACINLVLHHLSDHGRAPVRGRFPPAPRRDHAQPLRRPLAGLRRRTPAGTPAPGRFRSPVLYAAGRGPRPVSAAGAGTRLLGILSGGRPPVPHLPPNVLHSGKPAPRWGATHLSRGIWPGKGTQDFPRGLTEGCAPSPHRGQRPCRRPPFCGAAQHTSSRRMER